MTIEWSIKMKTFDKASWHIDGGEKAQEVVARFRVVFEFLQEKGLLTADGVETLEYAMDSSVSLNSTMVNEVGKDFLERYYDEVIVPAPAEIHQNLIEAYGKFIAKE